METYGKKQHCLWLLIQTLQDICHPFNGHILQISTQKIFFLHDHKGKTVCCIHFRRSQHNASHTVVCTDVDLLRFRNQHSRMYDIPVSVGRGIKFQPRLKGHRKRSFFYKYFCFSRKTPDRQLFLTCAILPACIQDLFCQRPVFSCHLAFRISFQKRFSLLLCRKNQVTSGKSSYYLGVKILCQLPDFFFFSWHIPPVQDQPPRDA